jgi:spore coat protein U-like protein
MKVSFYRVAVLTGALLCSPMLVGRADAQTQTATGTMTVSANVVASCSVVGGTLDFGDYDPIAAAPKDGSLAISVRCTRGVTAQIGMGLGNNPLGALRRMAGGPDFLSYELYKDGARSILWGNTGTDRVAYTATSSGPTSITVFGRVGAGQDVPVGGFSDTVTITVTF